MHLKSTLLLLVLAAGAGLWFWKGDDIAPRLGLASRNAAPIESKSVNALTEEFQPGKVTKIEIAGENPFVLEKAGGDVGWKLPGNWPLRKQEVAELAALFTDLRSRFTPIPIAENEDLTRYGLGAADKPQIVKLTANGNAYTLAFGEPKLIDGESSFTRSAYLRINDYPELIRLGPDVMPVLRRPAESYRRRQLFPDSERIKVASSEAPNPFGPPAGGSSVVALVTDKVKEIEARTSTKGTTLFGVPIPRSDSFTIKRVAPFPKPRAEEKGGEALVQPQRIAEAWELAAPNRDRVDPDRLQKILSTIPDLWVEEFATDSSKAGLDKPERTLTVTQADGSKLVLLVGAVAKTVEREEPVPSPPPMPGLPPLPATRKVFDEYRYAKLADNPQVFVLRADRLADLFPKVESLRDPRVVHFTSEEVQEITIAKPGQPPVKIIRKDGKWMLDAKPEPVAAEAAAVIELISQLTGMRSAGGAAGGAADGATVTVIAKEKRPDDQPPAEPRTIQIHLGQAKLGPWPAIASATSALVAVAAGANADPEPVPARVEGWPRVAMVDGGVLKAVAPEGGFRDRTLASFLNADKLILERDGKSFAFTKIGKDWKQTAPAGASIEGPEIEDLAQSLGRLRAQKFVVDKATAEDLKKYGLDSPRAKWTVLAEGKDVLVLLVGNTTDGGAYAKLASGDAIAIVPGDVAGKLLADFRNRKVWELDEGKVNAIEVDWLGKKFKLVRQGTGWEDPAAPKDPISDKAASELLTALGALRADRWAGKPNEGGLDKPTASITLTLRDNTKRIVYFGAMVSEGKGMKVFAKTNDPNAEAFLLGDPAVTTLTRERSAYVEKKIIIRPLVP